ncbi:MAG: hypothetical protein Unbinned338contig1000_22 [Prokaryotic dsDNA virus sp.]|nr:MAG: hypothetical protein Unbinned338contig1000_22 [Prokaryotic dsDNA virus sp.]|tara:strand:+ start:7760 stop:7978 length:219 start_codon:yes stop_codon:yes gene_type:complete
MALFLIKFENPETGEVESETKEFHDWTGRAEMGGEEVGPVISISAKEWAEDYAYTAADKGWHSVKLLSAVSA